MIILRSFSLDDNRLHSSVQTLRLSTSQVEISQAVTNQYKYLLCSHQSHAGSLPPFYLLPAEWSQTHFLKDYSKLQAK